MKRRDFTSTLAGLAGATSLATLGAWPGGAHAQPGLPAEGKDFLRLKQPAALTPNGKVVVTEFFWYGCPHCYAFEPTLEPWVKALPADVQFRLVPFDFGGEALREVHKRVFCTWDALGLVGAMHAKTWDRFHAQRRPINTEDDMLAFSKESGLDVAKVKAAWDSFGVQVRMKQATQVCEQYGIHETPMLAVQDRFETSPTLTGSHERTLAVAGWLIGQARSNKG